MRAIVRRVDQYGVVGDAEFVDRLQNLADIVVMLEHAVEIFADAATSAHLWADMRVEMHPGSVPPQEERALGRHLALHEVNRRIHGLVVDRLHAFDGKRTGVLDVLLANLAPARIDSLIVDVGGKRSDHAPRTELRLERWILRIIGIFWLFLGVQVIEIAEKLVEAMHGRQELVAVAEMVLAELPCGVAERL